MVLARSPPRSPGRSPRLKTFPGDAVRFGGKERKTVERLSRTYVKSRVGREMTEPDRPARQRLP